jgi:prevent-host-death family protein
MPERTVNIHEAKTHFSKLIARVLAGEEVVISKAGVPVARLVPISPKPKVRVLGSGVGKGEVWCSEDCWDPMTAEELKEWEDGPIFPPE